MSSYIVDAATIDMVVTNVLTGEHRATLQHMLKEIGFDTAVMAFGTRLGNELLSLNAEACAGRYVVSDPFPAYRYNPNCATPEQVLKAVRCLWYQCTEGTVPDTKLYGFLTAMMHCLASGVIGAMPEYDRA